MFAAGRVALGDPDPAHILHVGDDWAADVAGAVVAGWRSAWVSERPPDTPLPTSVPDDTVRPDLTLRTVLDVEGGLADRERRAGDAAPTIPAGSSPR
jgi:FMN phosphatase YigB (HAD superfamily)